MGIPFYPVAFMQSESYLLDDYGTNSVGAWSLRQLRSGVTNVVRVRRTSGSPTELDFTAAEIDDGTMLAWVTADSGTASGYVTTMYDQTTNGNDIAQAVAGSQPRIVNAGALETENGKATVVTKAVSGYLNGLDVSGLSTTAASFTCVYTRDGTNRASIHGLSGGGNTGLYPDNASNKPNTSFFATVRTAYTGTIAADSQYLCFEKNDNGSMEIWYDSVSKGTLSLTFSVPASSNAQIGTTTAFHSKSFQEFILWEADVSGNRSAIETDVNGHYSIY